MNKPRPRTAAEREAVRQRTEEMERRARAEGLDLGHPQGKERFEEVLKRAAKSDKK